MTIVSQHFNNNNREPMNGKGSTLHDMTDPVLQLSTQSVPKKNFIDASSSGFPSLDFSSEVVEKAITGLIRRFHYA